MPRSTGPTLEGLEHRDTVTDFTLPRGDVLRLRHGASADDGDARSAPATLSIRTLRGPAVSPQHRCHAGLGVEKDFVENAWVGRTIVIGDVVRLERHRALRPRCVMGDPRPRGCTAGSGHLAHGSPAQQGRRWRVRERRARRDDPSRRRGLGGVGRGTRSFARRRRRGAPRGGPSPPATRCRGSSSTRCRAGSPGRSCACAALPRARRRAARWRSASACCGRPS